RPPPLGLACGGDDAAVPDHVGATSERRMVAEQGGDVLGEAVAVEAAGGVVGEVAGPHDADDADIANPRVVVAGAARVGGVPDPTVRALAAVRGVGVDVLEQATQRLGFAVGHGFLLVVACGAPGSSGFRPMS